MLVRIGYEISYDAAAATPMVIMMRVHPSRARDVVGEETILTEPNVRIRYYHASFGNLCDRLTAPPGCAVEHIDISARLEKLSFLGQAYSFLLLREVLIPSPSFRARDISFRW